LIQGARVTGHRWVVVFCFRSQVMKWMLGFEQIRGF
jgi:hypothetical protein